MAFLHSVIGDNTKENREHLEKIGYVRGFFNIPNRGYIKTINPGIYNLTNIIQPLTEYINCIGNPTLFRAVTAMKDDADEGQWFTNGKEWIFCDRQDWIDMYSVLCSGGRYNYNKNGELDKFHKATLEELKEHFK